MDQKADVYRIPGSKPMYDRHYSGAATSLGVGAWNREALRILTIVLETLQHPMISPLAGEVAREMLKCLRRNPKGWVAKGMSTLPLGEPNESCGEHIRDITESWGARLIVGPNLTGLDILTPDGKRTGVTATLVSRLPKLCGHRNLLDWMPDGLRDIILRVEIPHAKDRGEYWFRHIPETIIRRTRAEVWKRDRYHLRTSLGFTTDAEIFVSGQNY